MPALEAAALQPVNDALPARLAADWQAADIKAALVAAIPESAAWSNARIEIPFADCNPLLGRQLDTLIFDNTPDTLEDTSGNYTWPPKDVDGSDADVADRDQELYAQQQDSTGM